MARPKKNVIRITPTISKDVVEKIEKYLHNPVTGKNRYGAMSMLVEQLLRQFIAHLEKPGHDPVEILKKYGIEVGNDEEEDNDY